MARGSALDGRARPRTPVRRRWRRARRPFSSTATAARAAFGRGSPCRRRRTLARGRGCSRVARRLATAWQPRPAVVAIPPSPISTAGARGERRRCDAWDSALSCSLFQFPSMAAALADARAAGRRRDWPDPAASSSARGGGSRIWRPRRPAREVAAPSSSSVAAFFGAPSSPLLPGRRPWRVPARGHGGEQVPGKRRGGAAAAAPPGAAARPQDHGDEAEDARAEGEGLRVNFPLVEGFFCKKPRICTISAVRVPDRTAGKSGRRGHAHRPGNWPGIVGGDDCHHLVIRQFSSY